MEKVTASSFQQLQQALHFALNVQIGILTAAVAVLAALHANGSGKFLHGFDLLIHALDGKGDRWMPSPC